MIKYLASNVLQISPYGQPNFHLQLAARANNFPVSLRFLFLMAGSNPNLTEGRHDHVLKRQEVQGTYKCGGCKEFGSKVGYKCTQGGSSSCKKFTLHEICATLPDDYTEHPFLKRNFSFRPHTRAPRRHCSACQDVMKGFVFRSESPDRLRLHPMCMLLPERHTQSKFPDLNLTLYRGASDAHPCNVCNKQIYCGAWRYRSDDSTVMVDLSCAKIEFFDVRVPRIAPESRSRKVMSTVKAPAKWIGGFVTKVGAVAAADLVADEIIN